MRLALLLLLASTPAFADREPVRDDIVDIRHARTPERRVFLGWTGDNRAVSHVADCGVSDGGGPFCAVGLEVVHDRAAQFTQLLEPPCAEPCNPYEEGFHWLVPTAVASHAIRTERAALDQLGPLQASAVGPLPVVKLDAGICRIDLLVGKQRTKRVATIDSKQCAEDGGFESFRDARVLSVRMSPDRLHLAVTIEVLSKMMEWTDPATMTVIVNAS